MCLAVPGKILEINKNNELDCWGKVSFAGVKKDVNLSYVPEANIGDYVIVHVGFAISVLDEEEAKETFKYLKQIGELSMLEDKNEISS